MYIYIYIYIYICICPAISRIIYYLILDIVASEKLTTEFS